MALVDEIGIGVGLFLLILIWTISIFLCLALSRAKGGAGAASVVVLILASVITLILWYIPRLPPEGVVEEVKVYDYFFIARVSLLTFLSFFVLVGAFFVLVHYASEPIKGKAIKMKRF
ncbi:transmembrane protein 218-like [Lineus longissimus]|uniref:transmembrane protein 218-like n=1 Tax=Lineus longissimus TaxID=88925 RepID=UPI002B4F36D0